MTEAQKLTIDKNGFEGSFYPSSNKEKTGVIVLSGDKDDDFLSRAFAKYFVKKGFDTLSLSLSQENKGTGVSLWKIEYSEKAVEFLKSQGISKIAFCGISMQAVLALLSASLIPEISMVIAFTPCDFVPWGFSHGKLLDDKNAEWPTGESLASFRGEEIPCHPSPLPKIEYWEKFCQDKRQYREMHSKGIFDLSERKRPVSEDAFIKIENIKGRIVLIGAGDDSMWDSRRYIERMKERLTRCGFSYPVDIFTPYVGTHLLLPQSLVKEAVPVFSTLVYMMFSSGRKFRGECKKARLDLDIRLDKILNEFKEEK